MVARQRVPEIERELEVTRLAPALWRSNPNITTAISCCPRVCLSACLVSKLAATRWGGVCLYAGVRLQNLRWNGLALVYICPFDIVVSGPLFGLYNGVYLRLFFLGNVQGGVGFSVLALFL